MRYLTNDVPFARKCETVANSIETISKIEKGARYLTPIISSEWRAVHIDFLLLAFRLSPFAYRSPFITTALNEYTADKVHVPGSPGYDRDLNVELAWALSGSRHRRLVKFYRFVRIAWFLNDATPRVLPTFVCLYCQGWGWSFCCRASPKAPLAAFV